MKKTLALAGLVLLIAGCASTPPQPTVQVPGDAVLVGFGKAETLVLPSKPEGVYYFINNATGQCVWVTGLKAAEYAGTPLLRQSMEAQGALKPGDVYKIYYVQGSGQNYFRTEPTTRHAR